MKSNPFLAAILVAADDDDAQGSTRAAIANSTRCIATRTRTWSPTCRPIPSGKSFDDRVHYTPVEDPAVYENICRSPPISRNARQEGRLLPGAEQRGRDRAMRSGRLHVGGFSTGRQRCRQPRGCDSLCGEGQPRSSRVTTSSSSSRLTALSETLRLKGKKGRTRAVVQFGSPGAVGLFPRRGDAGQDYKIIFSGKPDQSVMGVNSGDYDAAAWPRRVPPHGGARPVKEPISASTAARNFDLVVRLCTTGPLADKMLSCFPFPLPARNAKAFDKLTVSFDQLCDDMGTCGRSPRVPAAASTRRPTKRRRSGKPTKRAMKAKAKK